MGFLDKFMGAFGFEGKDKKSKKDKNVSTATTTDKYANFNLHERVNSESTNTVGVAPDVLNLNMEQNLIICTPKSHKDVQNAVDYLRQNQSVLIDLENVNNMDVSRILDFLSGAIYGLNGSIHKYKGDSFILTPEGRRILTPEEKNDKE